MHHRLVRASFAALTVSAVATPAAQAAPRTVPWSFQMVVAAPLRSEEYTADLPFLIKGRQRIKVGRRTFAGMPSNIVGTAFSSEAALSNTRELGGYGMGAAFVERPLTSDEQRTFIEAVPLFVDADVLVVAAGHPACGGLTAAQAAGIATGAISNWRQLFPNGDDLPITVRYQRHGEVEQPRFGVTYARVGGQMAPNWAAGAAGASDAGVGAAIAGNPTIAAITAFSHLSSEVRERACVVPVDGVAPTNATVASRSYAPAYRVSYVTERRKPKLAGDAAWRSRMLALMRSEKVRAALRAKGVLVVGDPVAGG